MLEQKKFQITQCKKETQKIVEYWFKLNIDGSIHIVKQIAQTVFTEDMRGPFRRGRSKFQELVPNPLVFEQLNMFKSYKLLRLDG